MQLNMYMLRQGVGAEAILSTMSVDQNLCTACTSLTGMQACIDEVMQISLLSAVAFRGHAMWYANNT